MKTFEVKDKIGIRKVRSDDYTDIYKAGVVFSCIVGVSKREVSFCPDINKHIKERMKREILRKIYGDSLGQIRERLIEIVHNRDQHDRDRETHSLLGEINDMIMGIEEEKDD